MIEYQNAIFIISFNPLRLGIYSGGHSLDGIFLTHFDIIPKILRKFAINVPVNNIHTYLNYARFPFYEQFIL